MNRLFSDFFRKFEGGILGVFGTIWGRRKKRKKEEKKRRKKRKKEEKKSTRLFKLTLNSLFNDQGVNKHHIYKAFSI